MTELIATHNMLHKHSAIMQRYRSRLYVTTVSPKATITKRHQAKPIIYGKFMSKDDTEKAVYEEPTTYNTLSIILNDNIESLSVKSIVCNDSMQLQNIDASNKEIMGNSSSITPVDGKVESSDTVGCNKLSCDRGDLDKVRQVLSINSPLLSEWTICNTLHDVLVSKELTDEWIISNCDTEEKRENIFLKFLEEHSNHIFRSNDPTKLLDMLRSDIMVTLSSRYHRLLITLDSRKKLNDAIGENKEHPINSVPDLIIEACSCIHDDVANMVMHYSGKNVVCTDMKHKVVWMWNDITKIWIEGSDDMLINSIMVNIRPIVLSCIEIIRQSIKSGDDNVENLDILGKKSRQLFCRLGSVSYCASIVILIRERSYNPSFIDMLDNNNDILPINNGNVINLRTGEVRNRIREDYCTFICPTDYTPGTTSIAIDNFLDDITLGDNDVKLFLQGILGLCLTGHTHTQQMYIFYGPGGTNGKTTLINMVATVLGSFFVQAHKEVFLRVNGGGNVSPYIAELRGKRMAVFCESEVGDKFNESQIKAFTEGDKIKCKPLYKSAIEFTPHFKPFVLTNHKPSCSTDQALWSHLIIVPFDCKYVDNVTNLLPHERIKNTKFKDDILDDKLAMSALFNWLVAGAMRMYNYPLILPKRIADATNEYKHEQDIYTRFVNSRLLLDESGKLGWKIYGKNLYAEFIHWCKEDEGISPISNKFFGMNVKKVIGGVSKDRSGLYYSNYRLLSNL